MLSCRVFFRGSSNFSDSDDFPDRFSTSAMVTEKRKKRSAGCKSVRHCHNSIVKGQVRDRFVARRHDKFYITPVS